MDAMDGFYQLSRSPLSASDTALSTSITQLISLIK